MLHVFNAKQVFLTKYNANQFALCFVQLHANCMQMCSISLCIIAQWYAACFECKTSVFLRSVTRTGSRYTSSNCAQIVCNVQHIIVLLCMMICCTFYLQNKWFFTKCNANWFCITVRQIVCKLHTICSISLCWYAQWYAAWFKPKMHVFDEL